MVNLSGPISLGLVVGADARWVTATPVGAAAIGSYTTFSTWMLESQRLSEDGQLERAFANALLSLICGLGAVSLGRTLGSHL